MARSAPPRSPDGPTVKGSRADGSSGGGPAAKAGPAKKRQARRRYAVPHDLEGPKVRLGIAWFVLALGALAVGPLTAAVLYGLVAPLAAAQTAQAPIGRAEGGGRGLTY